MKGYHRIGVRSRVSAPALVVLAACRFAPGTAVGDGASGGSDAIDDDAVAPICPWPFEPTDVDPCAANSPTPSGALELGAGAYTYDTETGELRDPTTTTTTPTSTVEEGVRTIWVTRFAVPQDSSLRATGALPLRIVASSTIDVAGKIDVASYWTNRTSFATGAGANPASCPADPPGAGRKCLQHAGSGGGGAGFGGAGGAGGPIATSRNCDGVAGLAGGAGGLALGAPPAALRGGCAGRDGSHSDDGEPGDEGRGGPGGGAIQLVARDRLTISGTVHAGGSGGTNCSGGRAGGGAGGTGGMIELESTTIELTSTGTLAANGGGGGGGCEGGASAPGTNGLAAALVTSGGAKNGNGSDGGNGGYLAVPDGQTVTVAATRGGGGGGGGVGFIRLRAATVHQDGTVSPAPRP
jgi:hypothetical protein